ncbi:GNAT family N-acetyltransferase [Streptosporangium lutulentum]|uniref:RimJ/RimL family protein N-acetyltransferase n=1 Tax=Streptosporangium lutulentum TaxID=1461250 RepID=A0ABT9Q6B0_9ACTN|nr:GNAT family protein [Streptosporangium lutulentum]MDP9841669.1 RimJ/RimL family protein N-acetyltransferase [Streptosporangium lutulentum]
MRHVEISGKRLRLREVTVDDVDALHAVYGDPTATEHLPFDPRTREEVEEVVAEALRAAEAEPRLLYVFAVTEPESSGAIGVARLHIEADHPHSAEIGLGLRPDHWGRGMGTDLIRLTLLFGFKHLRLHRIWGARSPANTAAQLAMLVAGMVEEGRIRHHVRARGVWRDSIVHSALEDEWEGHRET